MQKDESLFFVSGPEWGFLVRKTKRSQRGREARALWDASPPARPQLAVAHSTLWLADCLARRQAVDSGWVDVGPRGGRESESHARQAPSPSLSTRPLQASSEPPGRTRHTAPRACPLVCRQAPCVTPRTAHVILHMYYTPCPPHGHTPHTVYDPTTLTQPHTYHTLHTTPPPGHPLHGVSLATLPVCRPGVFPTPSALCTRV